MKPRRLNCLAAVIAGAILVCGAPAPQRATLPAAAASPMPITGLAGATGGKGLRSLSYSGQEILSHPDTWGGVVPINNTPRFTRADGSSYAGAAAPNAMSWAGSTVTQTYPWGSIAAMYTLAPGPRGRLWVRVRVANTSRDDIEALQLSLIAL